MIGGLKPYASTAESSVPWLVNVPAHWRVAPAFAAYTPKLVKNTGMTETTVLSLSYGQIVVKPTDKLHGLVPESFETYQIIDQGDIIVRTTDLQNDQRSLRVGISRHRGIITSAYMCLRVRPAVSPEFGYLLLNGYDLLKVLYGFGSGLRQNLDFSHIKRMPVPIPPPDEQAAIVRFLGHADRKIRKYIAAKRRLLALLTEQKQAIIHRAVTRGLDPNVRLKPSGMDWLGDIPAHWSTRRIKQTSKILRGKFSHRPRNDLSLYDGPYPFIQTGAVARARKYIETFTQTLNEKGLAVSKLFPRGTLVMAIAANIGDVAVMTFDACFPDSVVGFVPRPGTDLDFLFLALSIMKDEFVREAPVNTQGNLNVERIGAMCIPLPDLAEQREICAFVDDQTRSIDGILDVTQKELGVMREFRTRLITDVVTGKLDVRAATQVLPELAMALEGTLPEAEAEDTIAPERGGLEPEEAVA